MPPRQVPQKTWEIATLLENHISDRSSFLNECMRLLDDSNFSEEFLRNKISEVEEVNNNFFYAIKWLVQQGLSIENGAIGYALALAMYMILWKEKDNEDKPERLTDEWLGLKQQNLQRMYQNLPQVDQGLIDKFVLNPLENFVLSIGHSLDSPRAQEGLRLANSTISRLTFLTTIYCSYQFGRAQARDFFEVKHTPDQLSMLQTCQNLLWIMGGVSWGINIASYAHKFFDKRKRDRETREIAYTDNPNEIFPQTSAETRLTIGEEDPMDAEVVNHLPL